MALTGRAIGAIIGVSILCGAICIALCCCICSYYPSLNQKILLFCRCGKLFRKKRLPFSADKSRDLKSVKVAPLEAVVVVNPYAQKLHNFSEEPIQNRSITDVDSARKIITIPGSIPQEDDDKVENKIEIKNTKRVKTPPPPPPPKPEKNVIEAETKSLKLVIENIRAAEIETVQKYQQEIKEIEIVQKITAVDDKDAENSDDDEEQPEDLQAFENAKSEPSELDVEDDNYQDEVREMEEEEEEEEDEMMVEQAPKIGEKEVEEVTRREEILPSPIPSSQSNKSDQSFKNYEGVILGVDATPKRNGGYCVVRDLDLCEFYSADTRFLPWRLNNVSRRGNSAEFEMKNLMFALLNWEDVITSLGKLWVYTDNMAIIDKGIGSRQGINVRAFLRHLNKCQNVKIMNNKNHYVHTIKNPKTFTKYILPADHLSRKRIYDFRNHITQYFPEVSTVREGFYTDKVEDQITKWIQGRCKKCGFQLRTSNSLRDNIKTRMTTIRFVNSFPQKI